MPSTKKVGKGKDSTRIISCTESGRRPFELFQKAVYTHAKALYKIVMACRHRQAVKVLKVEGVLVYCTCTVTKEENEGIVVWTLDKFPCMQLVPAKPLLGGPGMPCEGLTDTRRIMLQRFGPEEDCLRPTKHPIYKDTIGFFIAKFIKTE